MCFSSATLLAKDRWGFCNKTFDSWSMMENKRICVFGPMIDIAELIYYCKLMLFRFFSHYPTNFFLVVCYSHAVCYFEFHSGNSLGIQCDSITILFVLIPPFFSRTHLKRDSRKRDSSMKKMERARRYYCREKSEDAFTSSCVDVRGDDFPSDTNSIATLHSFACST